jgi:transposase
MAQPYSDDLRCAILLAYEAGERTLEELAEDFGVSHGYGKKIRQQRAEFGLKISLPPIWRALKKLGLRLKENSIRKNRTNLGFKKRGVPSNRK